LFVVVFVVVVVTTYCGKYFLRQVLERDEGKAVICQLQLFGERVFRFTNF
jgi:hypothetical protein